MKKKLYMFGMVMAFGIACIGCGKTTEVTDNTEVATATETVAEATTEAATKEKTTNKKDKTQNTTEDTQAEDDTQPDKTRNQGSQRTTETANRQTTASTTQQTTTATTQQPTTQAPVREQPTTQTPTRPITTQTTEAPTTCQHQWEEITEIIHHPPVMGVRGVRPAVIYYWYCFSCGCYYPTVNDDPCGGANGGDADYTVEEAVYEEYEAEPAWDEVVRTGRYRCTRCGATK